MVTQKALDFIVTEGENKCASDRWAKTDGLTCMHKNQGETNTPLRLLVLSILHSQGEMLDEQRNK